MMEGRQDPDPHPLLIEHVIENILNNGDFSKSDYLNLRLVCQKWNAEATKKLKLSLDLKKESDICRVEKLVHLLQNPYETMPDVQDLTLGSDFIPTYSDSAANQFQDSLEMRHRLHDLVSMLLDLVSKEILTFKLVMEHKTSLRYCDLSPCSTFVDLSEKVLKKISSGLERLKIVWTPYTDVLIWLNFGDKILRNIPPSVQRLKLKIWSLSAQDATAISSLRLPNMTRLSLNFGRLQELNWDWSILLDNFKNTLKILSLKIFSNFRTHHFGLPTFPNLTRMNLCLDDVMFTVDAELEFGSKFPKVHEMSLTILSTPQSKAQLMDALFPTGFVAPEVTSCRLSLTELSSTQAANLLQGFKGLRKLFLEEHTVNRNLSLVFQHCGLLEELDIQLCEIPSTLTLFMDFSVVVDPEAQLDNIFTGIQDANAIKTIPNWKSLELTEVKSNPGLSDLRNLKVLKIISDASPLSLPEMRITDVTGHFGFMQLPKLLEKLETNKFDMSEEFITELKARFGEDAVVPCQPPWHGNRRYKTLPCHNS